MERLQDFRPDSAPSHFPVCAGCRKAEHGSASGTPGPTVLTEGYLGLCAMFLFEFFSQLFLLSSHYCSPGVIEKCTVVHCALDCRGSLRKCKLTLCLDSLAPDSPFTAPQNLRAGISTGREPLVVSRPCRKLTGSWVVKRIITLPWIVAHTAMRQPIGLFSFARTPCDRLM